LLFLPLQARYYQLLLPLVSGQRPCCERAAAHEVEIANASEIDPYGPHRSSRPLAETRIDGPQAQRKSPVARYRRASGRITDILNCRRAITADTAVRLGRYFGNSAQFWLDLQGQHDIGVVERKKGTEITRRVRPADAA
jgi:plasmid maintenance system antidote protein VapI